MPTSITVVVNGGGYNIETDGHTVVRDCGLDDALKITGLLVRCNAGSQMACEELDSLGIVPPVLELDNPPIGAA